MTELEKLVVSYYDKKRSVKAAHELHDLVHTETRTPQQEVRLEFLRNEVFESVLPIIGIIIRKHFSNMQLDDLDDLVSLATMEYWKIINGNNPPKPYSDSAHFNFYFKVGIRAMLKAMHNNKPEVFEFFAHNSLPPVANYNYTNPEHKIFFHELPNIVYEQVMMICRFQGEERDVCDYIAKCKIYQEDDVKRGEIRRIGGKVTNAQFFEEYVDMLIAKVMEEIRNSTDITDMLSDEGAFLNPVYYSDGNPIGV